MTQETPKKKKQGLYRRLFTGRMFFVSVLLHLLFFVIAIFVIVQRFQTKRPISFQGGSNASSEPLEHVVKMTRRTQSMSAPQQTRIVTTAVSDVTLPDLPAMPNSLDDSPSQMAAAGQQSLGMGGPGAAGGAGGSAPLIPLFGFNSPNKDALEGVFYDLKQSPVRRPIAGMNPDEYMKIIANFVRGNFSEGVLAPYYKGKDKMYASQFLFPQIPADEGPRAFRLQGRVKPMMWLVHYKGRVIPPKSGTYRFLGRFDDVLVVRFNNKNVLDGCLDDFKTGLPRDKTSKVVLGDKEMMVGEPFKVSEGHSYPIEIIIGECPGGWFSGILLIQEDGVSSDKVPPFRLVPGKVPRDLPPQIDAGAPVWRAEAPPPALGS